MMHSVSLPLAAHPHNSYEKIFHLSTEPTTPEKRATTSPILRALEIGDEPSILQSVERAINGRNLSTNTTLLSQASRTTKVCYIGAGYVGGSTAAVMALHNPDMLFTVVDRDDSRIRQWNSRHLPIREPGLLEILRITRDGSKRVSLLNEPVVRDAAKSLPYSSATSECESHCDTHSEKLHIPARSPNMFFSLDISKAICEADVVFITVNTPTKKRGLGAGRATDITAFEAATKEVAINAKAGTIIVQKSTVSCGTSDMIREMLKINRHGLDLEVLCNPEFLAEGTAMDDLLHPSRVIIGADSTPSGCKAAATLSSMYESWVPRARIITTNTWSSELSKLVANAMLAQRISSINSISAICEATGADIDEVAHSVGLDPRIGDKFLRAGIGFGGSCFKKDILSLSYLAEGLGLTEVSEYWQQVLSINEWQRKIFVRSVITCLNGTLRGKKVTLLGYAFKKDTADMRESPALDCIKTLLEEESAEIAIYDTCCNPKAIEEEIKASVGNEILDVYGGPIKIYADPYQACLDSYAVLIMTNSDEFRNTSTDTTIQNKFPVHDPRPFQHLDPTETEILALQSYLSFRFGTTDPLRRFNDEPACEEGCIECATVKAAGTLKTERLDWSRIAYHLQKPKWVFDGRGVLDVKEMEELGVRVRSIGKAFKSD